MAAGRCVPVMLSGKFATTRSKSCEPSIGKQIPRPKNTSSFRQCWPRRGPRVLAPTVTTCTSSSWRTAKQSSSSSAKAALTSSMSFSSTLNTASCGSTGTGRHLTTANLHRSHPRWTHSPRASWPLGIPSTQTLILWSTRHSSASSRCFLRIGRVPRLTTRSETRIGRSKSSASYRKSMRRARHTGWTSSSGALPPVQTTSQLFRPSLTF